MVRTQPVRTRPVKTALPPKPNPDPDELDRRLDRELVAINDLYARLRREVGEDGLTGLEREAYRLSIDGYAAYRGKRMDTSELARVLSDSRRILTEGAIRRGLVARREGTP